MNTNTDTPFTPALRCLLLAALLLSGTFTHAAATLVQSVDTLPLIPRPQELQLSEKGSFTASLYDVCWG